MNANTTMNACKADLGDKGRCRHTAQENGFCAQHQSGAKVVDQADVVLVKANVNKHWADRFMTNGVKVVNHNPAKQNTEHAKQAIAIGRNPYGARRERNFADSGTPVFGREGAKNVGTGSIFEELLAAGYHTTDVHMYQKKDGHGYVLVLNFCKKGDEIVVSPTVMSFLMSCWGQVDLWANPPKEDGSVLNTVNCTFRQDDIDPEVDLHFDNGVWAVTPSEVGTFE